MSDSRLIRLLALVMLIASATLAHGQAATGGRWIPTWVSAQQLTESRNMPPEPGLAGNTLRQRIQAKLAGTQVRIVLSNQYGDAPLVIDGAAIARAAGGATIVEGSDARLRFRGQRGVVVLPGNLAYSDPVDFEVAPFEILAITLEIASAPGALTGHPGSRTTSYIAAGKALAETTLPQTVGTDHWYLLSAVEVWARPESAAIVVVGDSITDGRGSTTNQNDRWPDVLAHRLHAAGRDDLTVLNQGVGGGRVLRDGLGTSALGRFDRDVIAQPGVRWLILFIGVNDLGGAPPSEPDKPTTADDLIGALHQMILRAHSHGIEVIGATIMPFEGHYYFSEDHEAQRQALNTWIRDSGEFDSVIDFDVIARDPSAPSTLSAAVDGGDHLHPSAEGYAIMAGAIDLGLFED